MHAIDQPPLILRFDPPPPKRPPEVVHAQAMGRGARCASCPLYGCDRGPVMATIRENAPLIAIGEAPGVNEVDKKEGFVGASGRILNEALEEGGLKRAEISVSNIILCQPPEGGNFTDYLNAIRGNHAKAFRGWERRWLGRPGDGDLKPAKRHSTALRRWEAAVEAAKKAGEPEPDGPPQLVLPQDCCQPRLERDMAESKSLVTLAVGKQALEQTRILFGLEASRDKKRSDADKPKVASLKKQHGAPVLMPDGRVLIATYHPAFAMHDKCEFMPVIRENIARAARIARRHGRIDWREPHYLLSPDPGLIKRTLHRFLSMRAEVTVDIETDSGDAHDCSIRCIGLGAEIFDEEVIIVIPFRHMDGSLWWDGPTGTEIALLVRRVLDENDLVFQNGQFDTTVLLARRLMTNREKAWTDSLLLHHDTPDNDLPHDLGFITRRYFECPLWKENVDHKSVDVALDYVLHLYNARDVLATMRVIRPLRTLVEQWDTEQQYATDRKIAVKTRDMSELGLICNEWLRGEYSQQLNRACVELTKEFRALTGQPRLNPRSPPQLRELFYVDWGYVPVVATDGYEWEPDVDDVEDGSTSNGALTRLQSERIALEPSPERRKQRYLAVEKLLEFRAVDKIRGTYTDNLKTYAVDWDRFFGGPLHVGWAEAVTGVHYDEEKDEDVEIIIPRRRGLSLVRTTYKGHVVSTGRLASGDPVNFQNITKNARGGLNLRNMYVAPPGHVLVGADYEQIEARLYAIIAGDQLLLQAIAQKLDIHSLNAASLFCQPGEKLLDRYQWVLSKPKEEKGYVRTVAKRFCIAEGALVLTDRGEVPIEDVQLTDRVWDGAEWVQHDGVVYQGRKEVIDYEGLRATADHEVWVEDGRKVPFGTAATQRLRLARTGQAGRPLRFLDDHERRLAGERTTQGDGPVLLRDRENRVLRQSNLGQVEELQALRASGEALEWRRDDSRMAAGPILGSEEPLYEPGRRAVEGLRRSGGGVPLRVGRSGSDLDGRELWAASPTETYSARPRRHERPLRAGEPAVGDLPYKRLQPTQCGDAGDLGLSSGGMAVLAREDRSEVTGRQDARGDTGGRPPVHPAASAVLGARRRTARTYDLLNAGPRHRFTVSERLSSNCFGLIYGAGWSKIYSVMVAERNKGTGERLFPNLKEKDCQAWEANWHRLHPETKLWHERCHKAFQTFGFTGVPMLDFRKRFFPGGVAQENAIPNLTIQGSAASIANQALLKLAHEIPYRGWSPWSGLVLQVHDYLGVIVPEDRVEEAKKIVERCMYFEYEGMKFTAQAEATWAWGGQ